MRLGQTSAVYFFSKIGVSVIGFFATIYFTRTLGEEVYGFYAITLALVSWLGIIKSIGFSSAIIKRMSESEEPDAYLAAGTTIKTILTILISLGILYFNEPVNAYVGRPVAEFVALLLIASILSSLVSSALKGTHRVHIYAPLSMVENAAMSVLMVVFVFIGWELTGMLIGHAAGTLLISFVGLWIVKPSLVKPKRYHFVRLFDYAKFSWLGSVRSKSFSQADIIVLGLFVPAGLTGIYAVAYSLSEFLRVFGSSISSTLFPEMSKLSAEGDFEMVGKLTSDALAFAGLLLVPGVIGGAILGDRLMRVYGPGFGIGEEVLIILLVGILIYTYTKQLLNTLNSIDRPDLAFRANGLFVGTNLSLNVILVWQIGWVGAAIATATSAAVGLIVAYYYTNQLITFSVPYGEIARQWTAALSMGAVVYLARYLGEANLIWVDEFNAVFVVLLVGLGAAVYFVLLLGISSTFRTTVTDNLPFTVPLLDR